MIIQKNKLFILFLLAVNPIFGKENLSNKASIEPNQSIDEVYYRKSLTPIFLFGTYYYGVIQNKQTGQISANSYINLDIEVHANISFNVDLYSAFIYTRIGGNFSFYKNPQLSNAFGISGYIYDGKNPITYLGWSVMMGGGFIGNYGFQDETIDLGLDFFLRGQYNFHKYVGVIFGLSFQYFHTFDENWSTAVSSKHSNHLNAFLLGVNIGLAF